MGTRSKDRIKVMISTDISDISKRSAEVKKSMNDKLEDTLDFLQALIAQIPQSMSGPLITKTPKVLKKRVLQRIETIPEDEVVNTDYTMSDSIAMQIKTEKKEVEEVTSGRSKREASKKAANNIKKQQSLTLQTKLRRPTSDEHETIYTSKKKRESRTKRKKSARSSSDEEENRGPPKHSRIEGSEPRKSNIKKVEEVMENPISADETITHEGRRSSTMTLRRSNRKRSSMQSEGPSNKKPNIIDDTVIAPTTDEIEEPSMYEDAIGKPTPIMNSTMNINSALAMHKIMDSTVVLEPLPTKKLNETITLKKKSIQGNSLEKKIKQNSRSIEADIKSPRFSRITTPSKMALQDRLQQLKEAMANKEFDDLLTDDESSPELKRPKQLKKEEERKRPRRITRSVTSSEDEILNTPAKTALREVNTGTVVQEPRNTYKTNALFSPYAKESVKKRVEAFEQAGLNSPKPAVEVDAPTRLTRTKTRALAAAQAEAYQHPRDGEKTVAQKLARKSLARAKKISLAKKVKDIDEAKENKTVQSAQKISKLLSLEKANLKQQQRTTPLGKTKIQLPMSVNRIPHTPMNNQIINNHAKALSATRTNIISGLESFLQHPKTASKPNSADKIDDKKWKMNDEDARKKREEALRMQTEEKRRKRQEKELKNKMAREAKEKMDIEKRQKAEKEKEEKARLAQQMQEKQREEMERKRLAQLQRAQVKEERRKQEEQQRLLRLQEQEEAERILAEQRRREQEAEKRKEAETRAQQQAAAEALRMKNQMLQAQGKQLSGQKQHGPTNYILDSEPDEDESDDESRPKHVIPHWALPHVRKVQLAMQRYIPERAVLKFFDTRKCTPDLTKLFHGIDRSRLKRTSSAIWKTPPRYSMMEAE